MKSQRNKGNQEPSKVAGNLPLPYNQGTTMKK